MPQRCLLSKLPVKEDDLPVPGQSGMGSRPAEVVTAASGDDGGARGQMWCRCPRK
jgi:hypothetical protein